MAPEFFRRHGGTLVLLGLVALVAWWALGLSTDAAGASIGEPTPSLAVDSQPQVQADIVEAGTPIDQQTAASTSFDASAVPVIRDVSIAPRLNPLTYQGPRPVVTYTTYLVEPGDTPNSISEQFGLQPSTLLGGNPELSDESSLLQAGVEIKILPIDGVLHDVRRGDTLEILAEEYDVPVEDIIGYAPNNLEFPFRLYEGTQIMVPGAVREVFVWTPPTLPSRSSGTGSGIAPAIVGTGTFVWPVSGRRITQYYHYFHRGIDIGLPEGTSVYASDTGTVVWAAWNNTGYGNLIVIDHGNGYQTFYAHLSGYEVYPGLIVYQGGLIGYTGNTGRSSGPHIHFEIRSNGVQQDPFWPGYLP